jgi:hypothetical protein
VYLGASSRLNSAPIADGDHSQKETDMYLHPLIHTELTRQHQAEISRRALRATHTGGRDRQPVQSKETGTRIRRLIAALATPAIR